MEPGGLSLIFGPAYHELPTTSFQANPMSSDRTLIFNRSDVERLLTLDECIAAAAVYRRAAGQQHGVRFSFNA